MPEQPAWWTSSTVYQVYPRSFADSNGDGVGDLPGITSKLGYLEQLGVDVVWLSPIYQSPHDDNGYDISDYHAIDPVFGTMDDFDELLAAVHDRNMKLVMDLVVNHTSDEHPWFVESRSSLDNPKRDWYWWRPARAGMAAGEAGAEPTNWESFFSGPTWELDERTGEYYLHLFSRKQPDLNWENPDVRETVYDMMRWWLDRGIDGFRMDVVNMLSKDTSLPDGHVPSGRTFGDGGPYFVNGPRIHEFLHEMHVAVMARDDRSVLTVGETPGVDVDHARRFTDPARAEVDMVFQFEHVGLDHGASKWDITPVELPRMKASFARWQEGLADVGWNSLYWDNHDQPRVVSRFGDDGEYRVRSATALATALHMQRGTPYVYQGEELGMTNGAFAGIDEYRDIESINHYTLALADGAGPADLLAQLRAASRDNARTPVQWDDSEHAGFTTGQPWIGVNPNHHDVNAVAAVADPHSVFHHYRHLIELRRTDPVVALGRFVHLLADHEQVFAFRRELSAGSALVLCNLSGQPAVAPLDDAEAWRENVVISTNYADVDGEGTSVGVLQVESGQVRLRPWEAVVLRRHVGPGAR